MAAAQDQDSSNVFKCDTCGREGGYRHSAADDDCARCVNEAKSEKKSTK